MDKISMPEWLIAVIVLSVVLVCIGFGILLCFCLLKHRENIKEELPTQEVRQDGRHENGNVAERVAFV